MKIASALATFCAFLALAVVTACRTGDLATADGPTEWDAASTDGPVLIGTVHDPDGRALEGIQVTAHGGVATRWPLASTATDAEGRFRFSPMEGALVLSPTGSAAQLFVGVCVGSVTNVNPAAVLPWKDVYVRGESGAVTRVDFVFDPESAPLEFRHNEQGRGIRY